MSAAATIRPDPEPRRGHANAATAPAHTAGRPLRVLSIAHSAVSHAAGRKRYKPLLERSDIDLTLLVPDRWHEDGRWIDADPPQGDVPTIIAPIRLRRAGRARWYLHYYPSLANLIEQVRPDVIHLWEEPWSVVAAHVVWLRNRNWPETAIALEVDQNKENHSLPPPFAALRRYTLRHADHVLGRNQDALALVRHRGYSGPQSIIEYGYDPAVFRPLDRVQERLAHGVRGFTIGYVGRLVAEKGLDDVLTALAQCQQPIDLLIMGDGQSRASLIKMADALKLGSRVRFLPPGPPEQVARFMGAIDVLVLMTRTTARYREQFGRVIMEAQACGVPVVGSTCGSIPDVVRDGGWIVPERDPATLAACFDRLAASPDEIATAAAAGLRQAGWRFSYERIADALMRGCVTASRTRRARTGAPSAA